MYITNTLERLLGDRVNIRVFKILLKQTRGLTGRQLAGLAKTSTFKMSHVLRDLVAQNVLLEEIAGKAHLYQLNRNHIFVKKIVLPNLAFESSLIVDIGKKISAQLTPKPLSIILFGSISRGEETTSSDMDCLLIFEDKKSIPASEILFQFVFEDIIHHYGKFINIKCVDLDELLKKIKQKEPFIKNIVKDGQNIYGKSISELLTYGKTNPHKTSGQK